MQKVLITFRYKILLPWSIQEYSSWLTACQNCGSAKFEADLMKDILPLTSGALHLINTPCIVVDSEDNIVLWVLLSKGFLDHHQRTVYVTMLECGQTPDIQFIPHLEEPTSLQFLQDANESLALLGAALWLLHPRLAQRACEVMEQIWQEALNESSLTEMEESQHFGPTPFTAMAIISNKESLKHRDWRGIPEFYDLLTTMGWLKFQYNAGTMITLCGKVLAHKVDKVKGQRKQQPSGARVQAVDDIGSIQGSHKVW
ncbi:hypothetical protein BDZ97DRAFT_1758553 [Flammula alnicola]|nr:hypothetical protein BDZ97DRAFT_1758553 [Flammula alnicola]